MTLNDREKFIMHMATVMTLSAMGDSIDIRLLQRVMRNNRCRKLTDKEVNELWEDIKEEVLNSKSVYEEMIANFGMDHDMLKRFDKE